MPKILQGVHIHGRTFAPGSRQDEAELPAFITQEDADRLVELEVLEEGFEGTRESYEEDVQLDGYAPEPDRPQGTQKDERGEPVPDGEKLEAAAQVKKSTKKSGTKPTWVKE